MACRGTTQARQIVHWHTFPRTPKMNVHCERFNRTVQEEFLDVHEELLFYDLPLFNRRLLDWLAWFNSERPHHALQLKTPLDILQDVLASYTSLTPHSLLRTIRALRASCLFPGSSAVERRTVNPLVVGSIPTRGANKNKHLRHNRPFQPRLMAAPVEVVWH
jgi:hypothetical protein